MPEAYSAIITIPETGIQVGHSVVSMAQSRKHLGTAGFSLDCLSPEPLLDRLPRARSKVNLWCSSFSYDLAFRKIEDASGEFKGPAPLEVETFAGKETELFLIPLGGTTYELVCEIEGHFEAGMHGTIVVEPAR